MHTKDTTSAGPVDNDRFSSYLVPAQGFSPTFFLSPLSDSSIERITWRRYM